MPIVFSVDNAAQYLNQIMDIPQEVTSGYLYAWGDNSNGQLGTGNTINQSAAVKVSNTKWKIIYNYISDIPVYGEKSLQHNLGIDENDNAYIWGIDEYSLGFGLTKSQYTPFKINNTKWYTACCTKDGTFVTDADGQVYGSGANWTNGAYLDPYLAEAEGNKDTMTMDVCYKLPTTTKWKIQGCAVNAPGFIFALNENDLLFAWGSPSYPLTSDVTGAAGETIDWGDVPKLISNTKWKQVSLGKDCITGITENNDLYSWGQIPNITKLTNSVMQQTPVKISNLKFKQTCTGLFNSFAIDENDELYRFHYKDSGMTEFQYTPIKISSTKWKFINKNDNYNLPYLVSISTDGYLYTWEYENDTLVAKKKDESNKWIWASAQFGIKTE